MRRQAEEDPKIPEEREREGAKSGDQLETAGEKGLVLDTWGLRRGPRRSRREGRALQAQAAWVPSVQGTGLRALVRPLVPFRHPHTWVSLPFSEGNECRSILPRITGKEWWVRAQV